jgi:hypothetical protein
MDGAVFVSRWKRGPYQLGCASNSNLFYVLLQAAPRAVPTFRQLTAEILVGQQRWKEEDLLGGVGRHDKAKVFWWSWFSRYGDV